ncbi:carboxymuconolactone decarboxylase family protein [Sulfobacillus thermosulfidooxidans]|uniref:carboxymuconolactone decarboxylase family protein n=1 Tax=Sulfobacillus thermosulfidooxidans TaxID=28034 RepID=UPI00096BC841|nr:carboxymuconolactone decarboxylase family protein [Sulfobacillus thermosulfidooxidans]OLZ12022.1 hypothetical protein BFX05_06000 [Sulfobacillus thermosulfidooxidans]OLZ16726.1 hypothetical protein BFX06_14595 [Sulfobacillus thermosulfidooxidans]OLZ20725.1 hypothetical protein BFX07_14685 [Sulfobacillus thermosulfidooxidans]
MGGITIEDLEHFHNRRVRENRHMAEADRFFHQFGDLERLVYANGALDERIKELMGLAIAIATRCDECVMYHMTRCVELVINREKILETIQIAVLAGGSLTYPQARLAFRVLDGSAPSIAATESESDPT